jgi:hypothetical protein
VLFRDEELAEIQAAAREAGMTAAEWVRQALREIRQSRRSPDTRAKLEAIRDAYGYSFPTADIDQMLAEIEGGYLSDDPGSRG